MDEVAAKEIYFDNLHMIANRLINEENPVNSAIAETNATGFGLDPSDAPEITEISDHSFNFAAEIVLSGDSDQDRGWCGDELTVQLHGTFKKEAGKWGLDEYEVSSVVSNFDQEIDD